MMDDATFRRNVRIYELDFRYLIDLLNWWNKPPSMMLDVPKFVDLPPDAVVVSVHENYERMCLDVMVASEGFLRVFDGESVPRQRGQLTTFRLAIVHSVSCEPSGGVDG